MSSTKGLPNELIDNITSFFTFSQLTYFSSYYAPSHTISSLHIGKRFESIIESFIQAGNQFFELENFTNNFGRNLPDAHVNKRIGLANQHIIKISNLVGQGRCAHNYGDVAGALNMLNVASGHYCVVASLLAEESRNESTLRAFKIVPFAIANAPILLEDLAFNMFQLKQNALATAKQQNPAAWAVVGGHRRIPDHTILCHHQPVQLAGEPRKWSCQNAGCQCSTIFGTPDVYAEIAFHQLVCPYALNHATVQLHAIETFSGDHLK